MKTSNPTKILNNVCQGLGLSDSFCELVRQGYEMSSFIGTDSAELELLFNREIREELTTFSDFVIYADVNEPRARIYYNAAKQLGFID
jgi:hypothetical protein